MSHTTPATYLVWSIMSTLLGMFLVFHLWKFDRFKCLKLNNGPYSGAFKRLMTYTYLLSVPGIIAYAIGFAAIKYQEGFVQLLPSGIIPVPWQLWTQTHKAAILPLYLLFTISWSLEMVTHLEELCFWLFLVNSGSVQQDWFRSLYFRTWIVGSIVAVTYMPLVTIFTRSDPLKCEAYTFLAGSLGSLSLTLWFMPILWTFPEFIGNLKRSGVDIRTIVRLTTFHELNCIRVLFRFLFVVPLLVLAVDGVRPHQHVNESPFWTEFLTSVAAVGCVVSSAITLVIFFPRNVEGEVQSRHATREKSRSRTAGQEYSRFSDDAPGPKRFSYAMSGASPLPEYPPTLDEEYPALKSATLSESPSAVFMPNRRVASGIVIAGRVVDPTPTGLTEGALAAHNESLSNVHPFLHNFTSPIDIMDGPQKRWYVKRQNVGLAAV
ncbi:hypothetical protein DICSQDRAFT_170879 [Dichomitus squalens LYAD-421 SS1]|uniref:STE3-domain-containing protein n=1 Tax=Dichomitus squalens (strain LYAD-421) TaxID=732165 RepID=R7SX49_DICSQ|nr:uncharacterized protein DICSQDRAFT_170879 [Dichomitus squalens LYAD-421 SS1]EJF60734.1 hypothetical protein DICSQDRAFT_170879 [Dichomitus squalens LYAD-421 SS1]